MINYVIIFVSLVFAYFSILYQKWEDMKQFTLNPFLLTTAGIYMCPKIVQYVEIVIRSIH